MTKHVVVTSFTEKGFEKYGKDCIESFYKYWPKSVKLVVYYEGTNLRDGWKTINEVPQLKEWLGAIAPFQLMSGALFDQYDIQYDARTNRVIFIQNHALRTFKGKVFWMDGDCITHSPVPETFLDEILPGDKMCCYLGREGFYDSETGFIGYNYQHPECEFFLKIMENTMFSGIIFSQPRWWDMAVVDWSRSCFIARDPAMKDVFVNLSDGLPDGCMHPLINSRLGAFLDHKKGARKDSRSKKSDLMVVRTEPYWNCPEAE